MKKTIIIILMLAMLSISSIEAQNRRANPVKENYNTILPADIKNQKKPPFTKKVPGLKADTIIRDTLFIAIDTTKKHIVYPKLNGVMIGVNLWDPLMKVFGQSYGGIGVSAELSMWNRLFPYVELGFGSADNTPEDMNFTYKGKNSLYGKIGAKYNFLYKKTSDYQALLGLNLGYSNFSYDIENVTINSDYWGQPVTTSINDMKSHATWADLSFSIRVKLLGNVSMGWSLIYHFILSEKKNPEATVWYIPGFGTKDSKITGALSVFYTLPMKSKNSKDVPKDIYTGEPQKD